ncbi:hypothetical protein CEXT_519201 [Caerostris extrusa]|uniref:Uncharacterized protein n=1 Tax=Caerostris extrusa TaxID=172846 RepID=A0AAV4RKV4_CAEEX|nr:hypothetical protein CEXT_519201 [Caerostris extrusa]
MLAREEKAELESNKTIKNKASRMSLTNRGLGVGAEPSLELSLAELMKGGDLREGIRDEERRFSSEQSCNW